jgi:hypothetical protein
MAALLARLRCAGSPAMEPDRCPGVQERMSDQSDSYAAERQMWRNFPRIRPATIVPPGPGQVSVWDYPRPPRTEPLAARVRVEFEGLVLADSLRALRVCETSSPPGYYIPPGRRADGTPRSQSQDQLLRVEGRGELLVRAGAGTPRERRGLELPPSRTGLLGHSRLPGLLPQEDGRLLGRRAPGDSAARVLLRRLGDTRSRGSVQGAAGLGELVASSRATGASPP